MQLFLKWQLSLPIHAAVDDDFALASIASSTAITHLQSPVSSTSALDDGKALRLNKAPWHCSVKKRDVEQVT